MFSGPYHEWNQKRIKGIVDFYGHKFFYMKKVLELGCGYADMGGTLYRLGAAVTGLDVRQEHLKIVSKKFAGIKTVQANLDGQWPLIGQKFDLVLDLGLLCHISDFERHLRDVCASTTHLVLETAVCDSDDPNKCLSVKEEKGAYDLSYSGQGCRPSTAAIERVLADCGMNYKRVDNSKYNTSEYQYDWTERNDNSTSINKRRMWFAVKSTSPMQFAKPQEAPPVAAPPPEPAPPIINSGRPVITTTASPKPPTSGPTTNVRPANNSSINLINAPPNSPRPRVINPAPLLSYNNDNKFVIVIPSYNNIQWCEKNILSALNQNYTNFRVIFTDDCSSDGTFDKVSQVVAASGKANRATLIKNDARLGALENLYNMIHSCDDDEIILTLDGDDWLAHNDVLTKLNSVYSSTDAWMTYGQYQNSNDGGRGVAQQIPTSVIQPGTFRSHVWSATHLRTFYTWLFKKIEKQDLMKDGKFMSMTWDMAMMFPMLEMSGVHSQFISDILYIYNLDNPINDHKVNVKLQQDLDRYVRGLRRYQRVERPPPRMRKVGLMLIATGKYHRFIQGMISSADSYFIKNNFDVTYYVFSDSQPPIQSNRKVVYIPVEHKPFPYASADRFKHMTNNAATLSAEDYLYYIDVDCLFVDNVGEEIIGNLVGVQHCGFTNRPGPVEDNKRSCLYVEPSRYKRYFGGGFSGGKKANYLALAQWCYNAFETDISNGIMPKWHDESVINRYFLDHEPDIILSPDYHYPQGNIEMYKGLWGNQHFKAKILLLDKDHKQIR